MKQLLLLFTVLLICNSIFSQTIQYGKKYNTYFKRNDPKEYLCEDENYLYFKNEVGQGWHQVKENTFVGFHKVDKISLESTFIEPEKKKDKNTILMLPFNGKIYAITKVRGKRKEPLKLYYNNIETPDQKIFIKELDFYKKTQITEGTTNIRFANHARAATECLSYSKDGNYLLFTHFYYSSNSIDFTALDKEMNIVINKKITLENNDFKFKKVKIESIHLDNEANILIEWISKIKSKTISNKKTKIISYYNRKTQTIQHLPFILENTKIISSQFLFKDGIFNFAIISSRLTNLQELTLLPEKKGIINQSILIGKYNPSKNEWIYEKDNTLLPEFFMQSEGNIKKLHKYSIALKDINSTKNTLALSLAYSRPGTLSNTKSPRQINGVLFFDQTSHGLISSTTLNSSKKIPHPVNKATVCTLDNSFIIFYPEFDNDKYLVFYSTSKFDHLGKAKEQLDRFLTPNQFYITKLLPSSDNVIYVKVYKTILQTQPGTNTTLNKQNSAAANRGTSYEQINPQIYKITF